MLFYALIMLPLPILLPDFLLQRLLIFLSYFFFNLSTAFFCKVSSALIFPI